jgi:hypothetical protein
LIKLLLLNNICKNNKANNTAAADGFAVLFGFEIYRGRLKKGKNGLFVAKMFLLYCKAVFFRRPLRFNLFLTRFL